MAPAPLVEVDLLRGIFLQLLLSQLRRSTKPRLHAQYRTSSLLILQRVKHAVIKVHVDALLFVIEAQLRMRRSAKNQKGDYRQRPKDSARYQSTGIPGERKAKDCTDQPGSNH
jgi:hypothetical protein